MNALTEHLASRHGQDTADVADPEHFHQWLHRHGDTDHPLGEEGQ